MIELVNPHRPIKYAASPHWLPRIIVVIKSRKINIPTPSGMIRSPTIFWNLKNYSRNSFFSSCNRDKEENRIGVVIAVIRPVICPTMDEPVLYRPR